MSTRAIPPLPQGYALDNASVPPLPKGYSLDSQSIGNQAAPKGFWSTLGSDIEGMMPHSLSDAAKSSASGLALVSTGGLSEIPSLVKAYEASRAEGHGIPYAATSAEAQGLGVNVPGMEESAQQGDVGGVLGHAVAVPAVAAFTAGVAKGAGVVSDAAGRAALLGRSPEAAYESALKPSTTIPEGRRAALVQTGLQEGIPVSKAGIDLLNSKISDLSDSITNKINAGAGNGVTVNPYKVTSRLNQTASRFSNQVNPEADLGAISDAGNEFLRNNPQPIPADQAQAMKQGTYAQLGDKAYGEMSTATKEAQKALARAIKEELASQIPEISQLNADEGRLLNLEPVLEKAINRIGNHQLIGIGTPITTAGVRAVTGSSKLAAAAGVMKAVLDDPVVKSRLAIMVSKGGNVPPATAIERVAAYGAALAKANNQQNQSQP